MLDVVIGKNLDQHKRALRYLDTILYNSKDINNEYKNLDNNIAVMKEIVQRCSGILDIPGVGVYNFPLTPQYDVHNGELHCFETYESPLEQNQYMLTINDVRFVSINYPDVAVFNGMRNLYNKTKSVCEAPVRELASQLQK